MIGLECTVIYQTYHEEIQIFGILIVAIISLIILYRYCYRYIHKHSLVYSLIPSHDIELEDETYGSSGIDQNGSCNKSIPIRYESATNSSTQSSQSSMRTGKKIRDLFAIEIDHFIRHRDDFYSPGYFFSVKRIEEFLKIPKDLKINSFLQFLKSRKEFKVKQDNRSFELVSLTPYRNPGIPVYGKFKCVSAFCRNQWDSYQSYCDEFQQCSKCNRPVYPFEQREIKTSADGLTVNDYVLVGLFNKSKKYAAKVGIIHDINLTNGTFSIMLTATDVDKLIQFIPRDHIEPLSNSTLSHLNLFSSSNEYISSCSSSTDYHDQSIISHNKTIDSNEIKQKENILLKRMNFMYPQYFPVNRIEHNSLEPPSTDPSINPPTGSSSSSFVNTTHRNPTILSPLTATTTPTTPPILTTPTPTSANNLIQNKQNAFGAMSTSRIIPSSGGREDSSNISPPSKSSEHQITPPKVYLTHTAEFNASTFTSAMTSQSSSNDKKIIKPSPNKVPLRQYERSPAYFKPSLTSVFPSVDSKNLHDDSLTSRLDDSSAFSRQSLSSLLPIRETRSSVRSKSPSATSSVRSKSPSVTLMATNRGKKSPSIVLKTSSPLNDSTNTSFTSPSREIIPIGQSYNSSSVRSKSPTFSSGYRSPSIFSPNSSANTRNKSPSIVKMPSRPKSPSVVNKSAIKSNAEYVTSSSTSIRQKSPSSSSGRSKSPSQGAIVPPNRFMGYNPYGRVPDNYQTGVLSLSEDNFYQNVEINLKPDLKTAHKI